MVRSFYRALSLAVCLIGVSLPALAHDEGEEGGDKSIEHAGQAGTGGSPYPSSHINLMSHLSLSELGGGPSNVLGNDLWGWTDPLTQREYAIFGRTNGTAFVDVTDPFAPQYLGNLPSHNTSTNTTWRDMKVYNNHAYIVADSSVNGLQIFDLTNLRGVSSPQTFTETAHNGSFQRAHNIAINEDSGFAYIVGSEKAGGGLYAFDLSNPTAPTFAGQFSGDGYTHDAQIVNYIGPDTDYAGSEIAFAANEDTLTIVDVTNKSAMSQISRTSYTNESYTHQGWVSEDHRFYFMNDELDERTRPSFDRTRTYIWNIEDLDNPINTGFFESSRISIDHNLYVKDDIVYEANYTAGLRVLEMTEVPADPGSSDPGEQVNHIVLNEIAFIDTHPTKDSKFHFDGAWSVFPFFNSETILVSDRQEGLFVAKLATPGDVDGDHDVDTPDLLTILGNFTGSGGTGQSFSDGDFNGDTDIDSGDTAEAQSHFTGPDGTPNAPHEIITGGNQALLIYTPGTGNLTIDPTDAPGGQITGFVLQSDAEFVAAHQSVFGNNFSYTSTDSELSEASFTGSFTALTDLGNVLPQGLSEAQLEQLLNTYAYTGSQGTGVNQFELSVVPEPGTWLLLLIGAGLLAGFAAARWRVGLSRQ